MTRFGNLGTRAPAIVVGSLAMSLDHRELGTGKVARSAADMVELEYFDSVANPVALRVEVPRARVLPVRLESQQRVYHRSVRGWAVGRVIESEFGQVRVRPPGPKDDIWLPETELYVRWDRALEDPVGVMQARAMETPHHYFSRRAFVDAMLEEDTACRGNRALTSSAIELYDHQIGVVSRVLSDPVRRFLLADEVGMGKTIEAGVVIRQLLLDHADAVVRIVAPNRMTHQWRRELRQKFFTDDPVLSTVDVMAHDERGALELPKDDSIPDLLVIDEAHHIARWAHGSVADRKRYVRAARLAHKASGLLLLSATPVVSNEATFLAILQLLDPDNYRLKDLEEFRRRVANRHELARAFVLFRPGQSIRRLHRNAARLRGLLGDDAESITRLDAVLAASEDDRDELDRRIRALRLAISDRHRIHYRMLRSRRADADDYPVRGRQLESVLSVGTEHADDISIWLDRWRNALVAEAAAVRADWLPTAQVMLDRALAFPEVLTAAVRHRLRLSTDTGAAELTGLEEEALRAFSPGPEERAALESWLDGDGDQLSGARTQIILDFVWSLPRRRKCVVFASFYSTGRRLAEELTDLLADGQVAVHLRDTSFEGGEAALQRFREERSCNVLVCDSSAEEGLNLQFADVLVHAELPADPNRLEQRIGRLDRHGPDTPVDNVLVVDGRPGSLVDAWAALLRDGFGVFTHSISALQFVIDGVVPDIMRAYVEDGSAGLEQLSAALPERLEHERREIEEQSHLDAIEAVDLTHPVATALRELDDRSDELEVAHEALISQGKGHLRFTRRTHPEHPGLCSYWASDPVRGGEPLVSRRDLTAFMLGALSEPESVRRGSHDRGVVLGEPGARMWRAGDQFLDGLLRYVRERDDRGRAYGFWKHLPGLEAGTTIAALRVDVIVQPGSMAPSGGTDFSTTERTVLDRRASALLPPGVESVWIGPDLSEVTDEGTVRRLAGKYSTGFGDRRLHVGVWDAVERVLPGLNWEDWCAGARGRAVQVVLERHAVIERMATASAAAERAGLARVEALRGRQRLTADAGGALAFEEWAAEAVGNAVRHPVVVTDAMGLVIVSSDPLGGEA